MSKFALLSAAALGMLVCGSSPAVTAPDAREIIGRWTGVVHDRSAHFDFRFLVDIEIFERDGKLMLADRDRRRAFGPPVELSGDGNKFTTSFTALPAGTPRVTLRVEGETLRYHIDQDGMTGLEAHDATLRKDDAVARNFFAPRLDAHGARQTRYTYAAPRSVEDGIHVSTAENEGMDARKLSHIAESILGESGDPKQAQTEAILVMRHGRLVFEEYFWGQDASNPHIISSSAKSVTAIAAGIAWDMGKLALDKPVISYFPDRRGSLWARNAYPITVRHMLSMNSGTEWDDILTGARPSLEMLASTDVAGYMLDKPSVGTPGMHYNYDNGLPVLAALTIQHATGQPYEDFVRQRILAPMGIDNYRWTQMKQGGAMAAGGMYMTPRSMAKIGQMMLDQGQWNGQRIVSADWVKEATRNQSAPADYPYGFYWHLNTAEQQHVRGPDGFMALGSGGQIIAVFPSLDLVVVTTSANWAGPGFFSGYPFPLIDQVVSAIATK